MRILLLRHAEPDYRVDGLTPKGRREAELLSRRMERYSVRDFYTSPLGRARETAEYTLRRMGREAETLPWLAEFRGHYWDAEKGRERIPWDLRPRLWTAEPLMLDPDRWPEAPLFQGTNIADIWEETKRGTDALLARYGFRKSGPVWLCGENRPETIALFCHFGIAMMMLAYLTDISPMILTHRFLCLPSSLTEAVTEERVLGETVFRITRLGDISHLEEAGEPRSTAGMFPECYTGVDSTDPAQNGSRTQVP